MFKVITGDMFLRWDKFVMREQSNRSHKDADVVNSTVLTLIHFLEHYLYLRLNISVRYNIVDLF